MIDGHFGTKLGYAYLNDIIARFSLTLDVKERLRHPPEDKDKQHDYIYRLKAFQNLKSMTKKFVPRLQGMDNKDDNTFWELKLWIEYSIQNNGGEGHFVAFELLLEHALEFYEFKDTSTGKAKCRNIWNWYDKRGWTYHVLKRTSSKTEEEILMTRQERARSNAKAKAEKARKAVINAVTGLYADEYKKVNGSWHIGKIASATGIHREAVSKYLKQWEKNIEYK